MVKVDNDSRSNRGSYHDSWSIEQAESTYGVSKWSAGYFHIDKNGEVALSSSAFVAEDGLSAAETSSTPSCLSLLSLLKDIQERGTSLPLLLRFENILESQISRLNNNFRSAIQRCGYKGNYKGVFPIKVNQQCHVIEEIAEVGARFNNGFEAGSKPELIIALAHASNKDSVIVCNGYKDEEFFELGLHAQEMGYTCIFVIESLAEIPIILKISKRLGVRPKLGIRMKLSAQVGGHWNATSGDSSIFGLTISQAMGVVDTLRDEEMLDCLVLLHYHLGSQIPNIRDIRSGVLEASYIYADLVAEGAAMGFIDLGGGLAVDYDGSKSNSEYSRNYSEREYCEDIVDVVMTTLDERGIAHPDIITESGRALTAHSSVLLFNILDTMRFEAADLPQIISADENANIHALKATLEELEPRRLQEHYNDAVFHRNELRELFKRGQVSLRSRALGENLFLNLVKEIISLSESSGEGFDELEAIREQLADIYYGNFSLFQSLPDVWAIDQIFPVMPIHRLQEKPDRRAIIADITCDCDGKIDRFSNMKSQQRTLPLHELNSNEDYILGTFLVGAYQETLGDLHNLFGDPNVVSVRVNGDEYEFADEIEGDRIEDVLSYVEYQPSALKERFRKLCEEAVRNKNITAARRKVIMKAFAESMAGYTYYEH